MKVNINTHVTVELTPAGEAQLRAYYRSYNIPPEITPKPDEVGRYRFQLYDLMNIFGSQTYLGSTTLPFVNNLVDIDDLR